MPIFATAPITMSAIYTILCVGLIGVLYLRYVNKLDREKDHMSHDQYETIRQHLLNEYDDDALVQETRPILWVYVPHEYNTRKWSQFGSRSSMKLNQPYMQLTAQSIVQCCGDSFRICFIDDTSFRKLIPGWQIDLSPVAVSNPPDLFHVIRQLGMMQLLYIYGGMQVPLSFLCFRDLIDMYQRGTRDGKNMFVCENIHTHLAQNARLYAPDIRMMGAPKSCGAIHELIQMLRHLVATDYTANSAFLGKTSLWCDNQIRNGTAVLILGDEVGVKTVGKTSNYLNGNTNTSPNTSPSPSPSPIHISTLLGSDYIDLSGNAFGIWIPADTILSRTAYDWFATLEHKQLLNSSFILAKYFILALAPPGRAATAINAAPAQPIPFREGLRKLGPQPEEDHYLPCPDKNACNGEAVEIGKGVIQPVARGPDWVGFWRTPTNSVVWGLKPPI